MQLTFFGNDYWISPQFNGAALGIGFALASIQSRSSGWPARGGRRVQVRLFQRNKVTAGM